MMSQSDVDSHEVVQLRLEVWHPGCWLIEVTEQVPVGLLGFGTFTHTDGTATTRYTMYGDNQETIDRGLSRLREKEAVLDVAEMGTGFIHPTAPTPGNATRELLIENDPTPQVSDEFTARGFAYAAPVDVFDGVETWALYTRLNRETIQQRLDEVRETANAEITVQSYMPPGHIDPLPVDTLSHRQREVFELARQRGYYHSPKRATASELANELGISTSTFHEHLHKAEEKILDQS
jgi:DNA-binding CsgD family transcriptional regulator